MELYSYCIPCDDGAAPNPYWGVCTLVICKPAIRRTAVPGDWIVGTGAKHSELADGKATDMSGRLIYAMKVTGKMTLAEYDVYTRERLESKVPDWEHRDPRRRLGDSLYDFSTTPPTQRTGVHLAVNVARDLSGKNALLSTHFYYFGDQAVRLPPNLQPIAQNCRGHRRRLNAAYLVDFVTWLEGLGHRPGTLIGAPLLDLFAGDVRGSCAASRAKDDDADEEVHC